MNIFLEGTNKKEVDMMVKTEQVNNFNVVHNIPDYTKEQREEIKKQIAKKIYMLVYNDNLCIDTKVK